MANRMGVFPLFALLLILLVPGELLAQPAGGATPVGRWRTFDDKTGLERGLVVIEEQGGVLTGRIAATLDPHDATKVCTACKDARKNLPISGMTIITGMRRNGDRWDGGEILDPQSGSIYHCSMRLKDGGTKLIVRGYVGLPLFGRSQSWLRQSG